MSTGHSMLPFMDGPTHLELGDLRVAIIHHPPPKGHHECCNQWDALDAVRIVAYKRAIIAGFFTDLNPEAERTPSSLAVRERMRARLKGRS